MKDLTVSQLHLVNFNFTSDFSFRAALPLRNVKLELKSAATTPLLPHFVADAQYTSHTNWLQLSTCFNHHFIFIHCFNSAALQSRKMATGEHGLKQTVSPLCSENMDNIPVGLLRDCSGPACSGSVGFVVLENVLRTEAWVRAGDTAARNWGTQSWLVRLARPYGVFTVLERGERVCTVVFLVCSVSACIVFVQLYTRMQFLAEASVFILCG